MCDSKSAAVADTIVRTVELGMTFTERRQSCPGCGGEGLYRDTVTVPSSERSAHTIHTAAAISCGLYLRVVDPKTR